VCERDPQLQVDSLERRDLCDTENLDMLGVRTVMGDKSVITLESASRISGRDLELRER
jgi:hypothetical protein